MTKARQMTATAQAAEEKPSDILIVDDDEDNLRTLSLFFDSIGYRSRTFTDARSALSEIRNGFRPSLVISDYRMPDMDGLQFIEELKAAKNVAPIIMLTAHGNVEAYFKAFSLGVFEFVNKPVRNAELIRVVRTALHGGGR